MALLYEPEVNGRRAASRMWTRPPS